MTVLLEMLTAELLMKGAVIFGEIFPMYSALEPREEVFFVLSCLSCFRPGMCFNQLSAPYVLSDLLVLRYQNLAQMITKAGECFPFLINVAPCVIVDTRNV